jgi:glycosyltransferase involved in cell wall biosynthesis
VRKIKVVWLCHFTNHEVQDLLPIWKGKNEFAPWIPNFARGFEEDEEVELHIISPHEYLKKQKSIILRNVHYHFIPYGIPIYHRHWPGFFRFDIYSKHYFFRKKVKRLVEKIHPDVINLIGAENAYYSSAIFDIRDLAPVIVGIQGFISQFKDLEIIPLEIKDRIEVEERILKEFDHFYGEKDSSNYINAYNPGHNFYKIVFPINEIYANEVTSEGKIYDCIFFGRMTRVKGAEDFIRVICEMKKQNPGIKAIMIGGGNLMPFKKLVSELDCEKNIEFAGFIKSQKDVFEYIRSSKVFLVPPLKERLSMTIREAMFLRVPIIAYATGGIPYINEFDDNILLVNTGDYMEMARKALELLENTQKRHDLAEKSFRYAQSEFSLEANVLRVMDAYKQLINNKK